MIISFLLLISIIENKELIQNDLELYINIQDISDDIFDLKEVEKKLLQIESLINSKSFNINKNLSKIKFLNYIKKDLLILKRMPIEKRNNLGTSFKNFFDFGCSLNKSSFNSKSYDKICELEKKIWNEFGEFTYIKFYCIKYRFAFCIEADTQNDYSQRLELELAGFKKGFGDDSPELDYFFDFYCAISENKKDYEKMIFFSNKSIESIKNNYPKNSRNILVPQGFLLSGLVNSGRFNEAYDQYKKINKEHLEIEEPHASKVLHRIFKSATIIFEKRGDLQEAIKLQIKVLEKMDQFFQEKNIQFNLEIARLGNLLSSDGRANEIKVYEKKYSKKIVQFSF